MITRAFAIQNMMKAAPTATALYRIMVLVDLQTKVRQIPSNIRSTPVLRPLIVLPEKKSHQRK